MPSSEQIIRQARPRSAADLPATTPIARPDSLASETGLPEGTVIRGRRAGWTVALGKAPGSASARSQAAPVPVRDGQRSSASDWQPGAGARAAPGSRVASGPAALQVDLRELHRRVEDRGYAVGRERAEAELAGAIKAAGALAARMEAMAPRESSSVAHALAAISTAIARRVVAAELHLDAAVLVRALESAVAGINGSPEARVLLHPDQLERVRDAWEAAHGNAHLGKRWTFEADASLPQGGCVLRYEHGVVAAGLEAQIDEIVAAIDEILPGPRRARQVETRSDAS
jgi:flagellar biosynthesis/type III secretory pathway protein FliH